MLIPRAFFRVLRGDPVTDVVHDIIKFFEELPGLPIGDRSIDMVVSGGLGWGVRRMREDLPALVFNGFDDSAFDMGTGVVMEQDHIVLPLPRPREALGHRNRMGDLFLVCPPSLNHQI